MDQGTYEVLAFEEETRKKALEVIITNNLGAFYKVGLALKEINLKRLFRNEFETFEAYCRGKWDLGSKYAYRLIGSVEVVDNLQNVANLATSDKTTTGFKLPFNEAQVRPLLGFTADIQRQVWQKVLESGNKISSTAVIRAISEILDEAEETINTVRENIEENDKPEEPDEEFKLDKISPTFKEQYDVFYQVIIDEKKKRWKETSKKAAKTLVKELNQAIMA